MPSTATTLDALNDLIPSAPVAVLMQGTNAIAPDCPKNGLFQVIQWATTTKGIRWNGRMGAPQGWDTLVAREDAGHRVSFVIITDLSVRYCIDLEDDCYQPLIVRPDDFKMQDTAEYLSSPFLW